MKHIKFEENINADETYSRRDKQPKKDFAQKVADSGYDDDFEAPETKKWHQQLPEEPGDFKPLSPDVMAALKKEANSLLHGESLAYETKMNRSGSSDQKWAKSLLAKGAMADRVAAATVLIQDSPIHHLSTLQNLVAMVKPAKKKDSLTVIETLSELFVFDLLLPDAKLRPFDAHAASELEKMSSGNKDHRKKILLNWIFEDQLKETYAEFIKCLNNFAHDTIEAHKEKAVSAMSKLLMHNPEQEKVLLSSIINKLGDPSQKVASKVIYHLCQVLYNHPNMKGVVLDEIEKMLFRPNISPKAQYYGVCFLNQFFLAKDDSKIAENLIRVYFSFFKACIKKGEIDSRLMSGILTGARRCQPFLREQQLPELRRQAHALHSLVHLAKFNVALHALALLLQIAPLDEPLGDRYYCALYKKLADPEALTTTLPSLLLNLIYRSIKVDKSESRVLAFLKRLLQMATFADAPRACSLLLVVARLARNKRINLSLIATIKTEETQDIKEEEEDDDEINVNEVSKAFADEIAKKNETNNLDENSTNQTDDNKESKKKKKNKEIQSQNGIVEFNDEENVKRVKKSKVNLWVGDKMDLLNEQDDEEVYHDIPLEEDEEDHKKKINKLAKNKKGASKGWLHCAPTEEFNNDDVTAPEEPTEQTPQQTNVEKFLKKDVGKNKELEILIRKSKNVDKVITEYSPFNRNPAYCGAELAAFTELLPLLNHFHPTVRLFADKILKGAFIQYSGDPLKDFSIARFLDRFAFKNPKKDVVQSADQGQIKTVKGSHPKFAQRKNYTASGIKSLNVNSAAYLNESSAQIPVDERFLYDYLHMRRQKNDDNSDAESDAGSVDSVEFEKYLDGLAGAPKNDDDGSDGSDKEEDIDYMKEMVEHSKLDKKGGKKTKESKKAADDDQESDLENDGDDGEDMSDWSMSGGDDDDFDGEEDDRESMMSDIDDDSDLELSDTEDAHPKQKKKKGKKEDDDGDDSDLDFGEDDDDIKPTKFTPGKKKGKKGIESMFASAEEFATILEETGTNKGQGTSQAVSNTENANVKQLNWEDKRNRWVKGYKNNKNSNDRKNSGKFEHRTPGNDKKPQFKKGGNFSKSNKGGPANNRKRPFPGASQGGHAGKRKRN